MITLFVDPAEAWASDLTVLVKQRRPARSRAARTATASREWLAPVHDRLGRLRRGS